MAAHGDAIGQPGHLDLKGLQKPGDIHGGSLPLRVRVGGHDDLLHTALSHPLQQWLDGDVIGTDVVHGTDDAVEHMVFAVELPAPLHGRHVPWVRHHADHRVIPLGRGTDGAQPPGGEIAAYGAIGDGAFGGNDGIRKRLSVLLRQAQYMKGQPLGGLSTDPRQTGKLFDQRLQRRGKILHDTLLHYLRGKARRPAPRRLIWYTVLKI